MSLYAAAARLARTAGVRGARAYQRGPWATLDDDIDEQLSSMSTSTLWAALGGEGRAPPKAEILARMGAGARAPEKREALPTDQLWEDLDAIADKYENAPSARHADDSISAAALQAAAAAGARAGSGRPAARRAPHSAGSAGAAPTASEPAAAAANPSIAAAHIFAPADAVESRRSELIHTARAAGMLAAKRADQIAPLHVSRGVDDVAIDVAITPATGGRSCIRILCSVDPAGETEAMAGCMGASLSVFAAVSGAGTTDIRLQLQ